LAEGFSSISAASICWKRCVILRLETWTSAASSCALADMVGELLHALVEALEIDAELSQLLLDDVDMPARFQSFSTRARC